MSAGSVLVTGVGGLIGREVAMGLHARGDRVVGTDIRAAGTVPFHYESHRLESPSRWHELIVEHGVTRVVHAGGVSGPMVLAGDPAAVVDINLTSLVSLLEAARIHQIERLVWFSSILAYGPRPTMAPVVEDSPLEPDTVYGATKAAGEALIRAYVAQYGLPATSLRVASCYGPARTTDCLIRTLVSGGMSGGAVRVRDVENVTRQHVHVRDVADAVCAALEKPALPQFAYNLGPGRSQTLAEIVADVRVAVPRLTVRLDDQGFSWNTFPLGPLDVSAARRDLDFAERVGLSEGAEELRRSLSGQADG